MDSENTGKVLILLEERFGDLRNWKDRHDDDHREIEKDRRALFIKVLFVVIGLAVTGVGALLALRSELDHKAEQKDLDIVEAKKADKAQVENFNDKLDRFLMKTERLLPPERERK